MTIDLEELRQKKAFEELQAQSTEEDLPEVTTAFLVVQDTDGRWSAFSKYDDKEFVMQREASLDDFVGGCSNIIAGAQSQQNAMATVMVMEQRAAFMQQQMMNQQEANRIASLLDKSKLGGK